MLVMRERNFLELIKTKNKNYLKMIIPTTNRLGGLAKRQPFGGMVDPPTTP